MRDLYTAFEPTYLAQANFPQYTYIPNNLGMTCSIENATADVVKVYFPLFKTSELVMPRETRYFTRDVDVPLDFTLEEVKVYSPFQKQTVYTIPRYVNTVVIKRVDTNLDPLFGGVKVYQPTFFFKTMKFT